MNAIISSCSGVAEPYGNLTRTICAVPPWRWP